MRREDRLAAAAGRPPALSATGRARLWLRIAMLTGLAFVMVPLHYLWRLFRLSSPWPRLFLGGAGRISGARVSVQGVPLKRDVFYVSNHVSWIDIPAIAGASGTAFVAKAEIRDAPVVGWLSSLNRTVFVERENRLGVAGQINALRDTLAENWSVTVFPEGTTEDGRSLTGMIAGETANSVTLKRADDATDVVNRADIEELRSSGLSLMPEGLEKQIDPAAMADLLAYLMGAL